MTGTAINPLLRAHYLAHPGMDRQVTLYVPWLNKADQAIVYPHKLSFETPEAQEQYVRDWVSQRTGEDTKHFSISWYPGRYAPEKGSILPVGDITKVSTCPDSEHLTLCTRAHRVRGFWFASVLFLPSVAVHTLVVVVSLPATYCWRLYCSALPTRCVQECEHNCCDHAFLCDVETRMYP